MIDNTTKDIIEIYYISNEHHHTLVYFFCDLLTSKFYDSLKIWAKHVLRYDLQKVIIHYIWVVRYANHVTLFKMLCTCGMLDSIYLDVWWNKGVRFIHQWYKSYGFYTTSSSLILSILVIFCQIDIMGIKVYFNIVNI